MGDNKDFDLDFELEKSIEKLVDEETGAAKAFVARTSHGAQEEIINQVNDVNEWKTQVIPDLGKRSVPLNDDDILREDYDDLSETPEVSRRNSDTKSIKVSSNTRAIGNINRGKGIDNRTKLAIIGISFSVVLLIVAIIIIALLINKNEENSYSYNYSQGTNLYNNGDYSGAVKYLENAVDYESGRKNIELRQMLADSYYHTERIAECNQILNNILDEDKYNEKTLSKLVSIYRETKDGEGLTKLVRSYTGTNCEKYISEFIIDPPTASVKAGSYSDSFELALSTFTDGKIYYTIDNSEPTTKDYVYNKPIKIDKGEYIVKAISVDEIGVMSKVVELKYVVDYKVPDAPQVTPMSGSYDAGSFVTIENLKDGEVAYYTTDGTIPTKESTKYVDPFEMPEGNTIVSVIIVNKYDLESSVIRRNYIVAKAKLYTYEEAKKLLTEHMQDKGDIDKDGVNKDGYKVSFEYFAKDTLIGEEMYLLYCDLSKISATVRLDYYYGVNLHNGKIYTVVPKGDSYAVTEY